MEKKKLREKIKKHKEIKIKEEEGLRKMTEEKVWAIENRLKYL